MILGVFFHLFAQNDDVLRLTRPFSLGVSINDHKKALSPDKKINISGNISWYQPPQDRLSFPLVFQIKIAEKQKIKAILVISREGKTLASTQFELEPNIAMIVSLSQNVKIKKISFENNKLLFEIQ